MRIDPVIWMENPNSDGEEYIEVRLPTHKIVCPRCNGRGTHVNPAIDGNGITESDRMDWADDDFMEDYFSGVYDVRCEECNGQNVVDEVDESLLTPELKEAWEKHLQDEYEYRAEIEAERRMGC